MHCKSCRWVKWNCGCTQTRSSKLVLVDLPLLHVVVELRLVLLLWSRKELDLAHGNCACCTDDKDIAASQKSSQLLSLAPHKSIPRHKCNSLWSIRSRPNRNFLLPRPPLVEQFLVGQFQIEHHPACNDPKKREYQ